VKPGRRRINFGWRADHPQGGHALLVFYKEDKRGEARLDGQYGDWGGGEAVGDPSLDAMRKNVQLILHPHEGSVDV